MIKPASFIKTPSSITKQIELLKDRNVSIRDEEGAKKVLSRISYYRIKGYLLPFKKSDGSYKPTSFSDLLRLIRFDQEMRSLILRYMEHVEITLRTFIVEAFCSLPNATGYDYIDEHHFRDSKEHGSFLQKLDKDLDNSKELYAQHYINKYSRVLPIWVAMELCSVGSVSRFFENLSNPLKKVVAKQYSIKTSPYTLVLHVKQMVLLRNSCAHFSRLYFRDHDYQHGSKWKENNGVGKKSKKLYPQFLMMRDLCVDKRIWEEIMQRLDRLFNTYKGVVNYGCLGFPTDWKTRLEK